MADVMVMKEIEDTALRLGVDLSTIDLDSIRLPPGEDCGIIRCRFCIFPLYFCSGHWTETLGSCVLTFFVFFTPFSDDEEVYQEDNLEFESGFGNIIVVDNLPVVPREKFEKLEGVVRKIYSQIGVIKEDDPWMPVDPETDKTLGYCFIQYNTPQVFSLFLQFTWIQWNLKNLLT